LSDPDSPISPSASPAVRSKDTARRRQPTSLGKITTGLAQGLGPEVPQHGRFCAVASGHLRGVGVPLDATIVRFRSDGDAPGSVIGGRVRNSCVPGGGRNPLAPNSMGRGDYELRHHLSRRCGWASSPTEGGGIGVRLPVRRLGPPRRPARQKRAPQLKCENSLVCASGSLREVEPPDGANRLRR
jgi:hypothetical protein